MNYLFNLDKKTSLFFMVSPLCIFLSYAIVDHKYMVLFNREMFFLVFAFGIICNGVHNYRKANSKSYEKYLESHSVPLVFWYPTLVMLISYGVLIYTVGELNKNEQLLESLDSQSEQTPSLSNKSISVQMNDSKYKTVLSDASKDESENKKKVLPSETKTTSYFIPSRETKEDIRVQFSKHLNKIISEKIENTGKVITDREQKIIDKIGLEMATHIAVGDWQLIHELALEYEGEIEQLPTMVANLLLFFGAPLEELKIYIDLNAQIHHASAVKAIGEGRIDDLMSLENMGVNFASELPIGLNLLDLALMSNLNQDGFEFAYSRSDSLSNFNSEIGVDTLTIALLNAETNSSNISYFVDRILSDGSVVVSEQHFALIEMLKEKNPNLIEELSIVNPELAL